ncbi:MAG: hypothetical protein JST49_10625 [Bacteroidetes bacterium]|nr:hypothetical protein [Bacteroidota bacterium]
MKPAQLWKAALLCAFLSISFSTFSQTATLGYFEASALEQGDSSSLVRFATGIQDYASADSLAFSLVDGSGQTVYTASNSVTAWKDAVPYRIEGGVLYLTIEAGPFASLGTYKAEAKLKASNGDLLVYTNR